MLIVITELLNEIQELSIQNGKTVEQIGLKLSEETGECSQAILAYTNAEGSVYKGFGVNDIKEECIDVILVAMSLFYKLNGNNEELNNLLSKKMEKWQNKVNIK